MSKITSVRGMNDLPPEEVRVWTIAEETIKKVFNSYGYEEIRFPIVEKTELFTRSNESADIVTKEMYTFEDKGGDSISLRPEGTAGCVRAAIDNDLVRIDCPRLWYQGPMFRYERPQKGRSRQFQQSSAEAFGIRSAEIDAELIILSSRIWKELGVISNLNLQINNIGDEETRQSYAKSLQNYFKKQKIKFIRANVGDRYVKEKMQKNRFNLGGEQSGHIILGKFATTGDGLLVALEVLFSMRKGKKASELLNVFKPMPQILENIIVRDKNIINKLKCKKAIRKANKLMGRNGRLLVRKSGTEPKIRIMGESHNKNLIIKCIKIIKQSIKY